MAASLWKIQPTELKYSCPVEKKAILAIGFHKRFMSYKAARTYQR